MIDNFSAYVVIFKDAADHPRADCLLARTQSEAASKAVSQVKERYGAGSHVSLVQHLAPANLPVLLRDKFIQTLEENDQKLFTAVQISRISAEMLASIEIQREAIREMIAALKNHQSILKERNNESS